MKGIPLLYVEDDAVARDILCQFINSRYPSLPVYSVGTAREGVDLFNAHRHSIVMTDIDLPDSDGVSMARSIRSIAPDTVIVFISGSADVERLEEFGKGGSSHVVRKPVDCQKLFGVLDGYINAPGCGRSTQPGSTS